MNAQGRPFELVDLHSETSHGRYASLAEARRAARRGHLHAYEIWKGDRRIEQAPARRREAA